MTLPSEDGHRREPASPFGIGVRAAAIFAPLGGAIAYVGTLDLAVALLSTAASAVVAGVFFTAAASLGARRGHSEER